MRNSQKTKMGRCIVNVTKSIGYKLFTPINRKGFTEKTTLCNSYSKMFEGVFEMKMMVFSIIVLILP